MSEESCELVVEGMHCASCGLLIDDALEDTDGVGRAATDVRRGRTVVWFDPTRTTQLRLKEVVEESGYRAQLLGGSPSP